MALTLSGTNGIVGAGFTLDPSGASVTVGVGTFANIVSPKFKTTGNGANIFGSGASSAYLKLINESASSNNSHQFTIDSYNAANTYWNKIKIDGSEVHLNTYTGNRVTLTNTALTLSSNVNLVMGSGGGIDFSNATDEASGESSTESILYDYEAGSFEPVLSTSGGSSSFSGNATYNGGYYVRIGRMVHISMNIRGTFTLGSGSGAVYITGLPFTSGATEELSGCGNAPYAFIGIPYHSGLVPSSGYTIGGGMVIPNSTTINIYQKIVSQASNPTVNPATNLSTSADGINIHASGCYLAT